MRVCALNFSRASRSHNAYIPPIQEFHRRSSRLLLAASPWDTPTRSPWWSQRSGFLIGSMPPSLRHPHERDWLHEPDLADLPSTTSRLARAIPLSLSSILAWDIHKWVSNLFLFASQAAIRNPQRRPLVSADP